MKTIFDYKLDLLIEQMHTEGMQMPPAAQGPAGPDAMAGAPGGPGAGPQPDPNAQPPQDPNAQQPPQDDTKSILMAAWQQALESGKANPKVLLDFVRDARDLLRNGTANNQQQNPNEPTQPPAQMPSPDMTAPPTAPQSSGPF